MWESDATSKLAAASERSAEEWILAAHLLATERVRPGGLLLAGVVAPPRRAL